MENKVGFIPVEEIVIDRIASIYYFERSVSFAFEGEKHEHWEMLYVDKGEVIVGADEKEIFMKQGEVIFHKPTEWHSVRSNGKNTPNLCVVSFNTKSEAMKSLENKKVIIDEHRKSLLSKILKEIDNVFELPIYKPLFEKFKRKEIKFGSEQLIKLYLTEFLLLTIRGECEKNKNMLIKSSDNEMFNKIVDYLKENISKKITFDHVMNFSKLSRKSLQRLFKESVGTGVVDYFIDLKIEEAKQLIRTKEYNITQIAEILGYENVFYFSNQFKKRTGLTPTEYLKSIL